MPGFDLWKHSSRNLEGHSIRGAMFITHWDSGTFTTIRDSAVLRIVDNDFDWNNKTPRVVRRFNKKKKKGKGRWKGLGKVSPLLILLILFDLRSM